MKFKVSYLVAILMGSGLFMAVYQPYSNGEKESMLMDIIMQSLTNYHFQPTTIDDNFSEKAYTLYLDRIDNNKRWLTQKDVKMLEPYKMLIDDASKAGTYEFFNKSVEVLDAAIAKTQTYYREALAQPFDFTKKGEIQLDGDERGYAKSDKDLKAYWFESMKYETLTRLNDKIEAQKEGKDEDLEGLSMAELEAQSRKEALKTFDDWYTRISKLKREDRMSNYFNALTETFDPHTNYYKPIDKQNFDITMSGKLEGIGARLQTDGDYTKVSSIVVGGPAWKQGELEENDKIMKVRQGGEEEVVDIAGMVINDVVQKIRGAKGTNVILTVKKVDGSIQEIEIERDVVIMEEGFAKSLLLNTSAKEKVGYIRLPRFYADFQDKNGRRCAKDVATEVEKLKKENVKGIIIDLRNNGGGSLKDVVDMSGLFIEEGPIVQVKSRKGTPEILADKDPSVLWDGAIVVMVNSFSASASEILAAALQDYDRAIIVGSPSTFGKGTVQRFFDLDRAVRGASEIKPLGEIKLTMQKFYRINGGSTQLKGVTPDIILPDNYLYIKTGEKEQEHPMEWTEIPAVDYKQEVYHPRKKAQIVERSAARISKDPVFMQIQENAKRLKAQRDDSEYPLNLEAYQAEEAELEAYSDKFKDLFDNEVVFGVSNLAVDLPAFEGDEGKQARNENWIKGIKKDVYLKETLNIMSDMLARE